jgi:hypothetical protein
MGCATTQEAPSVVGDPKLGVLLAPEATWQIPAYNRDEWHPSWKDADKDCQDTRQEVLIAESTTPPVMDAKNCRVVSGSWADPYTGVTYTDPSILDIDHVIALSNAHTSGGWAWTTEQKQAFANDLTNPETLLAVYNGANRSKGDKSPDAWMPTNTSYHCQYLKIWLQIKERYGLSLTAKETRAIASKRCESY